MKKSVTIIFFIFFEKCLKIIYICQYMSTLAMNFTPNNTPKFNCEKCDFHSSNKKDFTRHINSIKHIRNENLTLAMNFTQNYPNYPKPTCVNCGKEYKDKSGLWRHKKKCSTNSVINNNVELIDNDLTDKKFILQIIKQNTELIKENSEFKQLMIEQSKTMTELAKKAGNNTTNNTTNNNQFNLNFFLNETCKNAMNIMDFVGQLQVGIKELEETGRLGYAEGISKIFINGLKQMNISDRPIHCSDMKRETLYIKNNNEWNKETQDKPILTHAIKHVANKNIKQITEWTKIHPEYKEPRSKENDKYLKIVSEAMSGSSEEETNKNYEKIIKNVIKETIIDKSNY
jgi:hypothetical protein